MGVTEHNDVGRWGDLLADDDFGLAKEISHEVKRMDEQIKKSITFWIVACEVMEVVTDKMLFAQSLP